jgi:hypothetical protein
MMAYGRQRRRDTPSRPFPEDRSLPVATPDHAVTVPGGPITIRILDNDQGEALALVSLGSPAHGSVTVNADQTLTYTPEPGFSGEDSFAYAVRDAAGETAEAIVSLLVDAGPIAVDDEATTDAATPVTVAVLANDADPEDGPLSLVAVAAPGHGSVTVLPEQGLRYQPQQGFTGVDSFTYSTADIRGATATAMVRVTVAESNGLPAAAPDAVTTLLGTPVTIQLAANDNDPDGDPLSLAGVTLPAHGTVSVNPDRSIVYTPAAGYVGEDGFNYTISDGRGGTATGAVSIMVERPNSDPATADDAATVAADTPATLHLLANDSDPDGDPLTLVSVTMPQHGMLAANADQSVTYTPSPGFSGEDGFAYVISDGHGGTAVGAARVTVEPPPELPAFDNGYAWRRRLVLPPRPPAATTLTDFVLYVDVTADWLRTRPLGGRIESAQGLDLCFELEDGTPLAYEIDLYDGAADNGAKGRLAAWVRLPSWAVAQQLRLFLYYGRPGLAASAADPAAVWAGYLAVWDVRSGADRSGQGRDLVMSGVVPQPLRGGAGAFDGAGAHGRRTSAAGIGWLDGLTAMTVQAAVRSDVTGERRGILAQGPAGAGDSECSLALAYVEASWAGAARAVQFQWRNASGSSYIISSSNRQKTEEQLIHATWTSGQAPRLFLDGVEESSPARAEANVGTPVPALSGDLYLGVAPGPLDPMTTGWRGRIDEVRIRPTALSPEHIAAEHANQRDPMAFYGLGGEEDVTSQPAAVALPLTATTTAGSRIDIDAAAAAFAPPGSAALTLTTVSSAPANGLATIVNGKLRYTPNAGHVGGDSLAYVLTDTLGRTTTARLSITVTQAVPLWAGAKSQLPWHSGGYSDLGGLEGLRLNASSGLTRELDMVEWFAQHGSFNSWGASGTALAATGAFHTWLTGSRACPAMNLAIRVFSASSEAAAAVASRIPASWPAKGALAASAWVSPRLPVGYQPSGLTAAQQRAQAMDVWQHAADGHFDHLWGPGLRAMRQNYIVQHGLEGRRVVLRPFWESNGAFVYGVNHPLFAHSLACAQTPGDAAIVRAAMRRFAEVAREAWPGCYLHFCPLRGGQTGSLPITDFIDPAVWDVIGPDYYDLGLQKGPPYANGSFEDRWAQQANETGPGGGPKGIARWASYVRGTGKRLGIGEWGLWKLGDANHGGGDNPTFIRKMFETFQANADIMAYEVYFNSQSAGHRLAATGSDYPEASAAYRQMWATLT